MWIIYSYTECSKCSQTLYFLIIWFIVFSTQIKCTMKIEESLVINTYKAYYYQILMLCVDPGIYPLKKKPLTWTFYLDLWRKIYDKAITHENDAHLTVKVCYNPKKNVLPSIFQRRYSFTYRKLRKFNSLRH